MMQTGKVKEIVRKEFIEQDLIEINERWPYLKEEQFTQISKRLLEEYGYFYDWGDTKVCYLVDLLAQARGIVRKSQKYLGSIDAFFLDQITCPDDIKKLILIVQNDDGKMSIKLPTDR